MTDQEQEPWQEPWPEKMYLLHPSIKTFGAMVSNPERREYVRADRIEELEKRCSVYARSDQFLVEEIKELEAKLTKAMEALRFYTHDYVFSGSKARNTLAELEGE